MEPAAAPVAPRPCSSTAWTTSVLVEATATAAVMSWSRAVRSWARVAPARSSSRSPSSRVAPRGTANARIPASTSAPPPTPIRRRVRNRERASCEARASRTNVSVSLSMRADVSSNRSKRTAPRGTSATAVARSPRLTRATCWA